MLKSPLFLQNAEEKGFVLTPVRKAGEVNQADLQYHGVKVTECP